MNDGWLRLAACMPPHPNELAFWKGRKSVASTCFGGAYQNDSYIKKYLGHVGVVAVFLPYLYNER